MKYRYKTRPYAHQVKALRKLLSNGYGGALLMDPRTGKTKTAIDFMSVLNQGGKIDRVLIVCPNRVMDVWVDELYRHCPRRFHTVVWDKDERKRALPRISARHDLTVLIVNFEAFATPGPRTKSGRRSRRAGRFKTRLLLQKWLDGKSALAIVDESHKIKSPSGKAANMIVSLHSHFPYRMLMTGTPVTKAKRAFDIYMQWKFLNPDRFADLPTVGDFKDHYGKWTSKNGFPQWLGGRNLGELRERIHQDAFSVRRSECFDLPAREDQIIKVPLRASARLYDELAENMVAEIEELKHLYRVPKEKRTRATVRKIHTVEASIKLVLNLRLAQITGGVATTDEGRLIRVGSEKLNVAREYLDDVFEKEEKIVAAARFKPDLSALVRIGHELDVPVFRLSGGVSREESTILIRDFKCTEGPALFVVQPAVGSLGIDLSSASRMLWYSLTPSWTDFTQCCDRIALSRSSTTFTFLLAENTVDEVMLEVLRTDGKVHEHIMERPAQILRTR